MEPQTKLSWADIQAQDAWRDIVVDLVVPGSGDVPSRVEKVAAKVMKCCSTPGREISAVVVPDSHTGQTYVLPGGRSFISQKSGMMSAWMVLGQVTVTRSFLSVPTTAEGPSAAIAKFLLQFTERQAAAESEKFTSVPFGGHAPKGFFVSGSIGAPADLQGLDVRDGILRLDLRSHNGTTGSFWVDLATLKVTKTKFAR